MAIEGFLELNTVFTTSDIRRECGDTKTTSNLLSRAVASGKVERVKRGVYVSHVGKGVGTEPDRQLVAGALFDRCVFAYQSALETYGCAHYGSPRLVTCFGSDSQSLAFRGVTYRCWKAPEFLSKVSDGNGHLVTSPDQTFVDCIHRPERALGYDNVCRSIRGLSPSVGRCLEIARRYGSACTKKVAFFLDSLDSAKSEEDERLLAEERAHRLEGFTRFGVAASDRDRLFVPQWRIYVKPDVPELLEG